MSPSALPTAADAAASATSCRQSLGASTRRAVSPRRAACISISPVRAREPRSAHRLALEVMRSVASATPFAIIQATRSAVSCCIASVDGTRPRIAAMATVLSVNEYT